MASQVALICLISLLLLLGCVAQTQITQDNILNYVDTDFLDCDASFLNRSSFGDDFVFGTASSAYQYEGAWNEGGRGPSIWDTYTHQYPERIANSRNGRNADVTTDQYHRYKEDVGIMKGMNFDAYRFSISWSRLLPNGKRSGGLNEDGVNYYKSLIKELKDAGLKPFVTLFHWDLPQALEDEYGGFLDRRIIDDFKDFAKLCFDEFGEDVKHWITFNEPYIFSTNGYATGNFAPGRCTPARNERNCTGGNSATEPYLVAHHQLLAHAAVVKLYKEEYQESQRGEIGITLIAHWYVPYSNKRDDQNAAQRDMDFMFGWFMHPLTFGDYPPIMRSKVGERLPNFDSEESKLVEGSFDFIGINYYTAYYSSHAPNDYIPSYTSDSHTTKSSERDGVRIGEKAGSEWLNIYAQGLRDLLLYTKIKYNNPEIYITENGIDEKIDDFKLSLNQPLIIDSKRIRSYFNHLTYLREAINNGVTVKGYFVWSLLDNFEWASGYTSRFGIYYVDFLNEQKRHPKLSALWFKKFLGVGGAQSIS